MNFTNPNAIYRQALEDCHTARNTFARIFQIPQNFKHAWLVHIAEKSTLAINTLNKELERFELSDFDAIKKHYNLIIRANGDLFESSQPDYVISLAKRQLDAWLLAITGRLFTYHCDTELSIISDIAHDLRELALNFEAFLNDKGYQEDRWIYWSRDDL